MNSYFYSSQLWPADELESVDACPYCGSPSRQAVDDDVRDWYYRSSAQRWFYWQCTACLSLFLDPRPCAPFVGKAYANYYTHGVKSGGWREAFKQRMRNECYSHWLKANFDPRFRVPCFMPALFESLRDRVQIPFGLDVICRVPPGRILDVGCGSGNLLSLAQQVGWQATGIEFDPGAVAAARGNGLNVIEGDYRTIATFSQLYDFVICSHVIEHVDNPLLLLELLAGAVKDAGVLALSFPNAQSHLRKIYRGYWRGYEAPRHLSIPAASWVDDWLRERFSNVVRTQQKFDTRAETEALLATVKPDGRLNFNEKEFLSTDIDSTDLVGFVCSSGPLPPMLT